MNRKGTQIIKIPLSVWESAETKADLEDWLIANNPEFVRLLRLAQKEVAEGKTIPLEEL